MGVEIAGSLRDLEFGQLLTILASMEGEGVLEIWNLPENKRIEMFINQGVLRCIRKNGAPVGAIHVKPLLQELLQTTQGAFEFHTRKIHDDCDTSLGWPLQRILLSANAEYDEQLHHQDDLPDPNQRYTLKPGIDLPQHPFLQASQPFFERKGGASAKEVARQLDLPLDRVRYLMLKMLKRSWITPTEEPPDTNWEVYRQPLM